MQIPTSVSVFYGRHPHTSVFMCEGVCVCVRVWSPVLSIVDLAVYSSTLRADLRPDSQMHAHASWFPDRGVCECGVA